MPYQSKPSKNKNNKGYKSNQNQRAAGRMNINVNTQQVVPVDQLINILRTQLNQEKSTSTAKTEGVIDVSNKTWDDLDSELDWIEEREQKRPTYAIQGDQERTLFTDAWDMQPIIDFCIAVFKASGVGSTLSNIHNTDIVGFIGYMCALTEMYLLSNPEVIGINGITREQSTAAQAFLQQQTIPEHIALMFLQLRPTQLPDGTKIVLLPHTFDRNPAAANNHITWVAAANIDLQLHQYVAIIKPIGAPPQAPVLLNNNNHVRTNWMEVLANEAERAHDEHYYRIEELTEISRFTNSIIERYPVCARTEDIFDSAHDVLFINHVWDVWFNYDVKSYISATVKRKYVGFGNASCYATLSKIELPITIIDGANGDIIRESRSAKERWVPWMVSDTVAHVQAFVAEINAMVASCIVNYTRTADRSYVRAPARALRCYYLALGHGDAMIKDYLP